MAAHSIYNSSLIVIADPMSIPNVSSIFRDLSHISGSMSQPATSYSLTADPYSSAEKSSV